VLHLYVAEEERELVAYMEVCTVSVLTWILSEALDSIMNIVVLAKPLSTAEKNSKAYDNLVIHDLP